MPQESFYEFRVQGRLSEQARHAVGDFSEMQIMPAPPETIIYGSVSDEARLHGILLLLEDLGLHIVSLHQIPDLPAQREEP
ncbi:hypothetical protein [Amycolatopsis taiwanensis]|uniref:Uncharacterized protein n=1 Tax=Amycolatopsis taiwanensis TaxID=342230 RepID=A0A9W6R3J3_9PSEU|nr:hypothetical protein [Amycolatopsis taiwanensis]GLY68854.1 hypothetical protein Atai01_54730 [Amycolatopsis taiwanensis]